MNITQSDPVVDTTQSSVSIQSVVVPLEIHFVTVLVRHRWVEVYVCFTEHGHRLFTTRLRHPLNNHFHSDYELIAMVKQIEETPLPFNIPDFGMQIKLSKNSDLHSAIHKMSSFLNSGHAAISSRLDCGFGLHSFVSDDGMETSYLNK